MKLLLLTCIVASALAAPADKTKREILPGDPRYDAKLHQPHAEHKHHENEVEIAKALGGYAGSYTDPDVNFDFFGLENQYSLSDSELLQYNIDAKKALAEFDAAVKISDNKASEQSKSVSDGSFTPPKVESVTVSSDIAGLDVSSSTDFINLRSDTTDQDADKESSKNADETKIETKSASDKISADASKSAGTESATNDATKSDKTIASDASLATDSLATPFFDSSFDSSFTPFSQSAYSPSFHSINGYNPGFDSFSTNYGINGGFDSSHPLSLSTYSGFDDGIKGLPIDSSIPLDFSQLNPVDFTKNVPYVPPSSFSSLHSPLTSTSFQSSFQGSFQPEIKIADGSFSGATQLTDAKGGYVY